ncbi:response regulator transcription factor [Formosa algae]|uniref:DNA-binding NarL/FixJ family response regulator n=1 Tax=Formosa algae TaxID=225843 RepID=A0A9X0YHM3_9FLAO|nr:response regulator transcription factor [Formosa algae]MBP1838421.1 DNA-binding NarL/FixJ family response regulator [Formosa algae]MDQ0334556.1 DNA-binding NarL/FixJ family response regulator [Formosa algae]OEI79101.1 DNA-binding response regulator [Formosa algae]PNW30140.1 DNA-binding response regulator [Formosa algae]
MKSSIVIADDHPLMLKGMTNYLTSINYNIVGSATDGQSAYNLIVKLKPEIAILDIRMPLRTGIEIAEDCKKHDINTKIILITFDKREDVFNKAKELNIYGYILKEFAVEEIENCIESVINNKPYFSQEIIPNLEKTSTSTDLTVLNKLTKTEIKIIKLIAKNMTSPEIADELSISFRTVDKHRSNIVNKLKIEGKHNALFIWATNNREVL